MLKGIQSLLNEVISSDLTSPQMSKPFIEQQWWPKVSNHRESASMLGTLLEMSFSLILPVARQRSL